MNSVNDDDRTWGSLAHLSALCGLVIPFGSVLAPLILWRTRGQRAPRAQIVYLWVMSALSLASGL